MNVVNRGKNDVKKPYSRFKNELVRKDCNTGIRGAATLPVLSFTSTATRAPRYQFDNKKDEIAGPQNSSSMGPPIGPPRSLKRRFISSNSTKLDSSSSGKVRPRVLASDSAARDTSQDFLTPRNKPTALRYISSSSRGGYSGRSARSLNTSVVDASVILAISEGRGMAKGEIGMAAVDLRHPHLVLCQFSDTLLYTHTLTKINYFNPVEIIVPHTFCEGVQQNQLYRLIKDHYPLINLTTVQRRHFNDAAGRQHIQSLCAPQYNAVYLQVLHKFYALTAAAAVLKYVEYIQCVVFARESLKIEYHSSENTMIIDIGTSTQLELVQPLVPSAGPSCCLLGVLGPTYTIGGIRALRAAILQPSCDREFIENRLDAVEDLIENECGLMIGLQDIVKKLIDIDKILLLCLETTNQNMDKVGEAQLNQLLLLKTTMDIVPNLVEALDVAISGRLKKIKLDLENPNYKEIANRIHNIIQEDAHLEKGAMGSLQRCFAVKPEINGLLDVARRTYSELIDDIQKIVEQLSETYDLPLRVNQNVMKGFHIVLPVAPKNRRNFDTQDLPPIFLQVNFNGANVTMTTEELVVLDHQAKEALNEIQKMSNVVISGLLKELRPFMSSLYKLCENVAEIDILLALAQTSSIGSYIRPSFDIYIDIKNSVHPLLDYNSQVLPEPNDIYASPEQNFTIITGPNMGGKSIYIKQIALMQIMSQLGCFLPATNAVLRICDRLFSRIGFNDSVELNASTFMYEMKEIQHILKALTKSSIIIIDELCRGTCTEEGTSIAWAICEELLMSDAFTFFTTHFLYLTRLQDLYYNVINLHAAVSEEESNTEIIQKKLIYRHKIEPGITEVENYGLALASKTNLPEDTVKLAGELAELISKHKKAQCIRTPEISDEALLYKLNARIRRDQRKFGNNTEEQKEILRKFKGDNPMLIQRLKMERNKISETEESGGVSSVPLNSFSEAAQCNLLSNESQDIRSRKLNDKIEISEHKENNNEEQKSNEDKEAEAVVNLDNIDINNNYSSVKSSNQLLTSVMNFHDNDSIDEVEDSQEFQDNFSKSRLNDDNKHFIQIDNEITEAPHETNNCNDNITRLLNSFTNSSSNTNNNVTKNNDTFVSDDIDESNNASDIAEALTQIIQEYSGEDRGSFSGTSISTDEELVAETIKEINQIFLGNNMLDMENIVLTPPLDFQD